MFMDQKNLYCKKCLYYPKQFTDSKKIPKTFQWFFFYRNRKNNPKIHMESQKTSSSQSNPEKKYTGVLNNAGS